MPGDAFVTAWGVCLPNPPVDNDRIEDVLGRIESQSAAVKRREAPTVKVRRGADKVAVETVGGG